MRKFTFLLVCILLAGTASAQIQTPQPSPSAKMEQMVGLTSIQLEYSRPSMRGREVFGNLVPYNKCGELEQIRIPPSLLVMT